jgi:hypothetical protein
MPPKLVMRIAKALAGNAWPAPTTPKQNTFGGALQAEWVDIGNAFFSVQTERVAVYNELDEFDKGSEEFSTALDILSDEAVHSEEGGEGSFTLKWNGGVGEPPQAAKVLTDLIERTLLKRKLMGWARDTLKYGDSFIQIVISHPEVGSFRVDRVVEMPVREMERNEGQDGLLLRGNAYDAEKLDAAYVQKRDGKAIAGFFPWQMLHLRWKRSEQDLYGRSLGHTARVSWRKLKAMEEALVINWLTRAFARLLFIIDVTGLDRDAAKLYVDTFKNEFLSRKTMGGDSIQSASTVVKDIFLGNGLIENGSRMEPGLTDVRVLDTSNTGFANLNPVHYYQDKILMACQVPKALMGLERDINAKSTLTEQVRRYARAVRRIQMLLSEGLTQIFDIELIINGIDPQAEKYEIVWPNPSKLDESEEARIGLLQARTDEVYKDLEVIDGEWIAVNRLKLSPGQWAELKVRVQKEVEETAAREQANTVGDGVVTYAGTGTSAGPGRPPQRRS